MKYFTSLSIFVLLTVPEKMLALEGPTGLVACKDGGNCDFCQLTTTITNITDWIVLIVGLIAVILLAYAGYRITSSRGDVGVVTEARKMIGNVAIGIFILVLSWTIVDTLMKTVTGGGFGVWNEPQKCGISNPTSGLNTTPINTTTHPGITVSSDSAVGGDGLDLDDPRQGQYVPTTPTDSTTDDVYVAPDYGPQ